MKNKKLFIFDLDGTLVDSYPAIQSSLNHVREKYGYEPVSYQAAKEAIGHGDKNFIRVFFSEEEADEALRLFKEHHEGAVQTDCLLMEAAADLLQSLKESGRQVALATNRPKYFTHLIIEALDIKKYFDRVLCADEAELKPHPKMLHSHLEFFDVEKEEVVFVGDMVVDMETAENASIEAIFVEGGSSQKHEVEKFENKKIAKNLGEILAWL